MVPNGERIYFCLDVLNKAAFFPAKVQTSLPIAIGLDDGKSKSGILKEWLEADGHKAFKNDC